MNIEKILKLAIARLNAGDITDNPHLEAEILLSGILKKPREFILAHGECELTKSQIANYKLLIKKRLKHIPIAYITDEKEFYGLKFKVNKNVLIPRQETELMVEEALKLVTCISSGFVSLRKRSGEARQPVTLADVGTGSGCVIITLAKLLNQESQIRNQKFIGIDISTKALAVAKKNALAYHVNKKIKFIRGNLLEPIINNTKYKIQNTKFVIVANLPYLTSAQIKNSPSIKYEPKLALDGGSDGLKYYRRLFKQINKLRIANCDPPAGRAGLRDIYALCEFDPRQTAKIKQLIKRELPEATLQIKKDLAGLNRLAIITLQF